MNNQSFAKSFSASASPEDGGNQQIMSLSSLPAQQHPNQQTLQKRGRDNSEQEKDKSREEEQQKQRELL